MPASRFVDSAAYSPTHWSDGARRNDVTVTQPTAHHHHQPRQQQQQQPTSQLVSEPSTHTYVRTATLINDRLLHVQQSRRDARQSITGTDVECFLRVAQLLRLHVSESSKDIVQPARSRRCDSVCLTCSKKLTGSILVYHTEQTKN